MNPLKSTDDYRTRAGVVLPFTPGAGYTQSTNEYTTAQSWIMTPQDVTTLIRSRRAAEPEVSIENYDIVRNLKSKSHTHAYSR